ncbi:hypothetical protein CFD26_103832 [Aspergillus turcosus]|uniref:Berberine/berberine-like domain-containing protein n=1 Tax=Aspergillus turcosus TaxID=1245748 RepID=A0A421D0M6_9EURO|nr:hypothetical protein CFD26_103832 [Aspergillus turcosus]
MKAAAKWHCTVRVELLPQSHQQHSDANKRINFHKSTMKIAALAATLALALVPSVSAWRVYFYQLKNEQGPSITNAGPGNPGFKCHPNVDPLNQKISSMRYYSDNPEGTTRCCIKFYDSPGCKGDFGYEFCRNQFVNFDEIGHDNDVSSYSTNYSLSPFSSSPASIIVSPRPRRLAREMCSRSYPVGPLRLAPYLLYCGPVRLLLLMDILRDIAPDSGAYMSEGDLLEPNQQEAFYGANYDPLYSLKQRYDPWGLFFALTAVGTEDWEVQVTDPSDRF